MTIPLIAFQVQIFNPNFDPFKGVKRYPQFVSSIFYSYFAINRENSPCKLAPFRTLSA